MCKYVIMRYLELQPHPVLRDYLACYFFLQTGDDAPWEELIIPDGTPGLMFVQQARFTRYCPAENSGRRRVSGSYLFGQKTRSVHYVFDTPGLDCFGVKFQPHGLNAFVSLPAGELTDSLLDASLLLGKDFVTLEDRLLSTPRLPEKAALLDTYFIQQCASGIESDHQLVQNILAWIHRQRGQVVISDLLTVFHLNYKRLERLFHQFVGVPPKTYCCITRFHSTLLGSGSRHRDNLTQLAYASGYYDQMHFIKEIRRFTHRTPKEFFRNGLGRIGLHQRQLLAERLIS